MNTLKLALLSLLLVPTPALAKPLLTNSEDTYESVCLDFGDTPERLIEICTRALQATGATQVQRIDMKDSLAWAHYNLDNVQEAERLFAEMLADDPKSPLALVGLGWMAHDRDDYETAAERFGAAAEIRPEEQAIAGLGSSLYRLGKLPIDDALGYLDAALAISPKYYWAMRQKGWLLSAEGLSADAVAAFEEVLEVNPDDTNAMYGAAYVLSRDDQWQEALPLVNRALQHKPDFTAALSRRSLILLSLGRPAQALKDGKRVIELRPNDSDGFVRVARAQSALGRTKDAIATLAKAEEIVGYDGYLFYWQADLLSDAGDTDLAVKKLKTVITAGDADYYDHELLSVIQLDSKRFPEARKTVDKALTLYPLEPYLMYYDSLILINEQEYAQAEARFDEAVAAELPVERLSNFLKQLVGAAQYLQAVQMRVRYSSLEE
ncbi:tetratricopeptide repeat protein [Shimia sp. Alg240-R146]|uniref:tetratricopeptide repeat protein n=1 Tax=Shimia sp. Alg240-R146 TaxID=2993449 RepID=UPI0022E460ED|nr:tetratricopeptide repeat protein [Shimia sp. Alg240-R146]